MDCTRRYEWPIFVLPSSFSPCVCVSHRGKDSSSKIRCRGSHYSIVATPVCHLRAPVVMDKVKASSLAVMRVCVCVCVCEAYAAAMEQRRGWARGVWPLRTVNHARERPFRVGHFLARPVTFHTEQPERIVRHQGHVTLRGEALLALSPAQHHTNDFLLISNQRQKSQAGVPPFPFPCSTQIVTFSSPFPSGPSQP